MGNKFCFVTGMHGNEYVPILALAAVSAEQIVANPEALKIRSRWKDEDLNSAFGSERSTYESTRAKELLDAIKATDTIIDFHSSDTANIPFCIVTNEAMLPIAKKTGLNNVVYMKYNIKNGGSLIDYRSGVSVEVGKHDSEDSFNTTIKVYRNLMSTDVSESEMKVFESYGLIEKQADYTNFTEYEDGQETFYPIFTGKSSYKFIGIKTRYVGVI